MKIWLCSFILWANWGSTLVRAQPVLPVISCSVSADSVVLAWRCKYAAVRAIQVSRSFDSTTGFAAIGQLSNLSPGIQSFTDKHPADGRNFYKVSLTFSSGLVWHSNHCAVAYRRRIDQNSTKQKTMVATGSVVPISLPPSDLSDDTYILPVHVSLSAATGHVRVTLPAISADTRYSLAFYDMQGHLVADIPHVRAQEFLIDKRNFQRTGTFRFVLRKDGVLLESACIKVFQ